jgi:hypothetical protein
MIILSRAQVFFPVSDRDQFFSAPPTPSQGNLAIGGKERVIDHRKEKHRNHSL